MWAIVKSAFDARTATWTDAPIARRRSRPLIILFGRYRTTSVTDQHGLSSLKRKQRNEKQTEIMIDPLQLSLH